MHYIGVRIVHGSPVRPLWWYPACLVVGPSAAAVWVSGQEQREAKATEALALNGSLVLGQKQNDLDGGFVTNGAFVGHVTGLTLWPAALGPHQLRAWSSCRPVKSLTLLAWADVAWVLRNDTGGVSSHTQGPCDHDAPAEGQMLLFTDKMTWPDARAFLGKLGLEMVAPLTAGARGEVAQLLARYGSQCANAYSEGVHVWLGVLVNHTTHKVVDVNNGEALCVPWSNRRENVSGMFSYSSVSQDEEGLWHQENPFDELCFLGRYAGPPPPLRLQGLCREMMHRFSQGINFNLSPTEPGDGHNSSLYFHGYDYFHIIKEAAHHPLWCIRRKTHQGNTLACAVSEGLPLGRRQWTIRANFCHQQVGRNVTLTLGTCVSDQFTCLDSCVHLSHLCDNRFDCVDGTDERSCYTCFPPTGYVHALPPETPVVITVEADVTRIGNTDLLTSALDLDVTLTIRWRDGRLQFRHLQNDTSTRVVLQNSEVSSTHTTNLTPAFLGFSRIY